MIKAFMNNRIKQIYEQAWFESLQIISDTESTEFDIEVANKYAFLFIQECSNVLIDKATQYDENAPTKAQTFDSAACLIKQHFGV